MINHALKSTPQRPGVSGVRFVFQRPQDAAGDELDFNEFSKDFFAQDEPQLGIEFGRADIAGFVGLVLGCGAVQVPGSELADFAPGSALPLAKNARVHPPCSPLNKSRVLNFWLRTKSVDIKLSFPLLAIQAAPGSFFWAA